MPNININCGCETTDNCWDSECPPVEKSFFYLAGFNRNCEIVRVDPGEDGLLSVTKTGSISSLDGSIEKPITLNIPVSESSDGSIVIQTGSGVVESIAPQDNGEKQYLTYKSGVFSFSETLFPDIKWEPEDIPTASQGSIAVLSCGGGGKVALGSLFPADSDSYGTGERRFLVINEFGTVTILDRDVNDAPDTSPETELDALFGLKDGKIVPIELTEGQYLSADSDGKIIPVELPVNTRLIVLSAPVNVVSYTGVFASNSNTYDLTSISEIQDQIDAGRTIVGIGLAIDGTSWLTSSSNDTHYRYRVDISGRTALRLSMASNSYEGDGSTSSMLVPYPAGAILSVTGTPTPASSLANTTYNVYVTHFFVE